MTAAQIPKGWQPCPATTAPAERDAPVWSRRMYPSNLYGPQAEQQYGVRSGTLRAPMDLTVREARKEYCCQGSCGHLIQPGQLHGSSAGGERRFCACCVATEKPQSEFTPRSAAA